MQIHFPLLSLIVFLPLIGSFFVLGLRNRTAMHYTALITTLATFALSLIPLIYFNPELSGFQFQESLPWIPAWGISYHLGIDGLSLFLLPLTGFLSVLAVLVSWKRITFKERAYFFSFLILETGMLGVFVSLDTILFYVFWEAMLIPMFLIIGIWGSANRRYAAVKFLIYTMAGSIFMLIAMIFMASYTKQYGGDLSFDITVWTQLNLPENIQYWLFAAFFIAFAIKVPIFPFHTWLPDAHVEAPTAGSVLLAGVLLKMGVYGILRFCFPLFPDAVRYFTPAIMFLGLIGIIYAAFVAFAQTDLKKLIAYSSVCHMGLIVIGIFAANQTGIEGGILQMVNHGLSTGALFILVGALYERTGTRNMELMGGLARRVPVLAAFFMIVTLSSIGLPGLNGFIGEFFLLLAAFRFNWWLGALSATTMVLGAIYMLWMYQRVMFEKSRAPGEKTFSDFSLRENIVMVPVIIMFLFIGLYPSFFLDRLNKISSVLVADVNRSAIVETMSSGEK
ncbi:MAG: Fe-S-binding domain-containing protein [Deltaproteobacteria bacterium HGW-Deltaproteobacteria-10]|nr:MAG: Fe-S-binding domain-containing protein [Deltaproteobacteria bacterium HGW-Deltaproteobacteria-10]